MLLKAISPMLPKEDFKSVVVNKSYTRLNEKCKWWFTIIALPSTLSSKRLGLLCKLSHAGSYKVLFVSTTPLPSHLPSPSHATSSNSPPLPLTTLSLPDSDNYPDQPHTSSSPTNTHCPPSTSYAESNPPPPPPPYSALPAPSDPFLEGMPTLLG